MRTDKQCKQEATVKTIIKRSFVAFIAAMAFSAAAIGAVGAQEFKSTVRIVVPFAAGGTSDILARILSPYLSKAIGQDVIVENKPGANGNIGADAVAHSKKDGTSLLLMDLASLAISPSLYTITYDPQKDLSPVTMVGFSPYILAVNPKLSVKTFDDLISYSKANPGKFKIAHSGIGAGNHLSLLVLAKHYGLDWKVVAYKGGADAIRAVVSGECDAILNGAAATKPYVVQGQIRGIAVTGASRIAGLESLPTFSELKAPPSDSGSWQGLLTTGGTPVAISERLNAEIVKILAMPEVKAKIEGLGCEVKTGTPEALGAWFDENVKIWAQVIKENGIKVVQ